MTRGAREEPYQGRHSRKHQSEAPDGSDGVTETMDEKEENAPPPGNHIDRRICAMDEQIAALLKIVKEEVALYRDLILHAREKTALLVRGSLEAILESNKTDETFNIKLRMLEDEMARLCQQLCQTLHIAREEFTLLKLADGAEQSVADEIRSQTLLFKNLVEQLKGINQRNRKLVENSLHFSRGLLDFIANTTRSHERNGLFKPYSAATSTISNKA